MFCFLLICYYLINTTSLKTVKKWEEILKRELGKEIVGDKVTKIKCKVCIKHEQLTLSGWKVFKVVDKKYNIC